MITSTFRRISTHSASIIISAMAVSSVIRLISSMCMTRILNPSAFGIVGVLSSISFVIAIISDVGITPFVVRHLLANDQGFLDEVWSIRLVRSLLLTAFMAALAKPLSILMEKPDLFLPIIAWSLIFTADGLSSMFFATAIRHKQIFRLNFLDVIVLFLQTSVAIVLGLILRTYWAIIIAIILGAVSKALLSYKIKGGSSRSFSWSAARAKELWSFSKLITISGLFGLILSQTDKLVLARTMTLAQYGVYALAASLSALPLTFVGSYTHQVLYPAFVNQIAKKHLYGDLFYAPFMKAAFLYVAGVGFFTGIAPLVVNLMYDDRFSYAGVYLRILLILPLCAIYSWSSDQFCIAAGKTGSILKAHIVRVTWLATFGSFGWIEIGPLGIVIAVGTMELPAIVFYAIARRKLDAFILKNDIALGVVAAVAIAAGGATSMIVNESGFVPYIKHTSMKLVKLQY